jgi:hypothetical protein
MNALTALFLGSFLVASISMAADTEKSTSETTDTSKNVITGTVTKTTKVKRKVKNKNGGAAEVQMTDKVKTKKNGQVEESVKVDSEAKPAN